MNYHNPVLLKESIDGLAIKPNGIYVDVTFGGGGHSKEILKYLNRDGKLFAFDQDEDAKQNSLEDERFTLIPQNFRYIKRYLRFYNIKKVDGILADLGVSSHQFDVAERGFSTRFNADLDMRMNQTDVLTAYGVINNYKESQLSDVLFQYGELRNARSLAKKIAEARIEKPIKTSFDLKQVLNDFIPKSKEHKVLAQIFQGIRIEVNQEMEALKEFLLQVPELLNPNGRLSVISYHSLEDRLVKRFIKNGMFEGEPEKDFYGNISVPMKKIGKLIIPSIDEIKLNNRARSAKLRIATLK
ncbi:16S rRNA (cytosine(1402)-N(4))-methyltransferase RsmH [Lutibacter sp.]|uniref:16S rRNA (cytosine(1402)-N(4))-methyltransferase RsmH n=1 Tax=Lutibacter sp. TaxID=1925666 RepID=UPI0025BFF844|nr:16S rRNA (cytosine(1402)-N(4))-methyltransferase RsmH [Lutibacter sp.]MCF6180672.1 16S rRNA (cytosine(1402)-N(4))-methyltransferase RsmH [Lutibacter sp.]